MKISELPKATAATDEDIAVIVQDGETRKISRKTFLGRVPDDLALQDGTLQLTENGETVGIGVQLPAEPSEETKTYADNAAEQAETHAKESAQQYASDAQSAAEKAAKSYTDAAIQTADTAAQGYATTAQDNAIQQAAALAQEAQSAAETAAQQYADAARQAAEATAQEYADAAEAAAKAADPTDLLLTDRLLQLGVGGTAIGEGVQLPQEKFELWNDITLESDTTNVTVTQTDDGRPLKIKKLFIFFYGQFSATPGVYVRLGGNNGYMSYTALGGEADTPSNWWLRAEKVGPGFYQSIYAGELSQGANVADATNGYQANIEAPLTDISGPKSSASQQTAKEVNIATYTSLGQQAQIRAGSHIRIYGVMEEDE